MTTDQNNIKHAKYRDWESPEIFKLLVEAVSDYAIYMLDVEGYIQSWNIGAQRAKNYNAEEIIGKHFSVFYTPEERKQNRPQLLLSKALLDGRVEDEGWRVRKDGSRFWADVIVTAVFGQDGELRGFAKVTRDMTEKRNLTTARAEAIRASQAKTAFLANMSHELRTPLNAIIGYAEMIEEQLREEGSDVMADDVNRILFSSRHLLSIVSDILNLSKVEAGQLELHNEIVNISELLQEVVATIKPLAEHNGNEIRVVETNTIGGITTDRVRLRQILYNLLSNAAKFTHNGTITLAAEGKLIHKRPFVTFEIIDTGVGIPEDQVELIFERFYQVEARAHLPNKGGTGLGLAISRMLCEALGGNISARSVINEGTIFTVNLPTTTALPH